MRKYAQVKNGKVVEIFDLDQHFPNQENIDGIFHPDINFIKCPNECEENWLLLNGEFVAPTNYKVLREKEYPNFYEFLDAQVKLLSKTPSVKEEGQTQLDSYVNKCFAVKAKYPKT